MSDESRRILHNAAVMPGYNGTTTVDVVDEILAICNGQVFCNGVLREFVFTPITAKSFRFHTEDWYARAYPKG